jgi:hypothetical protein
MDYLSSIISIVEYSTETCTAPKNRGGGAEDDISLNAVAAAATA